MWSTARRPEATPSCSVVFATLDGWPQVAPLVHDLATQVQAAGGELIVADGSSRRAPDTLPRQTTWLTQSGAGTFTLRLAGLRRAVGDVVIVTEDHCIAPDGWCERILELFRRYPDADIVQGRVDNGSCERLIDWAGFLVNQSQHLPPVDPEEATRQIGIVGVAVRRPSLLRLLDRYPDVTPELLPTSVLRASGLRVVVEESLGVTHFQSETWLGHAVLHFHNAKAIAGMRRSRMTPRDWARLVFAPALVPYRAGKVVSRSLRKQLPTRVVLGAAPGVLWLYASKSAGECLGYLVGSGQSERRLH